jgi:glutamyl-tRNA reductase
MAALCAASARHAGATVTVTSRTDANARTLAARHDGYAVPWGDSCVHPETDLVLIAISGTWVPTREDLDALHAGVPVVDLSSPAALDADEMTSFAGVDDLDWKPREALPEHLVEKLDTLISRSGREYCRWLRIRDSRPAILELSEAVQTRCDDELAWLRRKAPDLTDRQLELAEQMLHRVAAGILHAPRTALHVDDSDELDSAVRKLFGL